MNKSAMYKLILPIRYIVGKPISFLAMTTVAMCVFVVIVVMTIMTGLVNDFKHNNHSFSGDAVVGTESLVGFPYYEEFIEKLEQADFIEAVSPVIKGFALVSTRYSLDSVGLKIMGIKPAEHDKVTGFSNTLHYNKADISNAFKSAGRPDAAGCIVGIDLWAERDSDGKYNLGERPSARAFAVSCFPLTEKGALLKASGEIVNTETFYFSDVSRSSLAKIDGRILYIPFENAQLMCGMANPQKRVNEIRIKFKETVPLHEGCEKLKLLWLGYKQQKAGQKSSSLMDIVTVKSWKTYRRESIAAMEKEQTMLVIMFGFVALTVVFVTFVVFYMIASHKTKDVGILKSLGVSNVNIFAIFSSFAVIIGLIGSAVGMIMGKLVLTYINNIEDWLFEMCGFQLWDRTVYVIGDIPNQIDLKVLLLVAAIAVTVCLIGAAIPSMNAARLKPTQTLQVNQL